MNIEASTVFTAVLTLLGGGTFAAIVTAWFMRKKTAAEAGSANAQAVKMLMEGSINLVEPLNTQIDKLEARVAALTEQVDRMYRQLRHYEDKYGPPTPTSSFYPIKDHKVI